MAKKRARATGAEAAGPEVPSSSGAMQRWLSLVTRDNITGVVGFFALTLAAYYPAMDGSLLWDDQGHITRPVLQSIDGLRRIWFEIGATQQYYPLLHSAFWLEHQVFGDVTFGYHLINVILHTLSALLVVAIMRRLRLPGAWLGGAIFAVHPVAVEGVAWISEQKSTLSGFFFLSAALTYLVFDESRKWRQYVVATALFLCALASKTVTASLPAVLLILIWWRRGRIDAKNDALPLAPWLAVGAAAGLTTAWVERQFIGAQGASFGLSPVEHLLLAGRDLCFYAYKAVIPFNLIFFYPRWELNSAAWWQWLFPLVVLIAAGVLLRMAIRAQNPNRAPFAVLLAFACILFPVLGFLNVYPFVYSWVADHFQYLGLLAIVVPGAVLLTRVGLRIPLASARKAAAGLLLLGLAALTWGQTQMYTDVQTLYRETIARNPTSWIAKNNLADVLMDEPAKYDEAIGLLRDTLRLKPDSAEAHNNLGSVYSRQKKYPEAVAEFRAAIRLRPNFPQAHDNLGNALGKISGNDAEAESEIRLALRQNAEFPDAHNNLGTLLSKTGHTDEAMAEYREALRLDPDNADARNNIATLLAKTPGGQAEALEQFRAAVAAKPDSAEAQSNLGASLSEIGRFDEALAHLTEAVRLDDNNAQAHSARGATLMKIGRTAEAEREFARALEIQPDLVEGHNNLGTLYGQENKMKEAVGEFQAALRLDPNSAEAHANLGNVYIDLPGRLPEAMAEFQTAVRLKPGFAGGHLFLGMALSRQHRSADAIREFETALKLSPDFAEAHQALGIELAHDPARVGEALGHLDAALKLKPDPETQKLVDQLRGLTRRQ